MQLMLAVALGGALGSVLRFLTTLASRRLWPEFPWGTLIVNGVGSFLIGVLWAVVLVRPQTPEWLRLGLMTGLLGGYTTLSALALESVLLAEGGAWGAALLNLLANLLAGVLACAMGLALARALLAP